MAEIRQILKQRRNLQVLVVLFSLNQKLLFNRSERGMVEGGGDFPGLILTTSVAFPAEIARYAAEDFTAAKVRVIGRDGLRHRTGVVIANRVSINPEVADEAVVSFKLTRHASLPSRMAPVCCSFVTGFHGSQQRSSPAFAAGSRRCSRCLWVQTRCRASGREGCPPWYRLLDFVPAQGMIGANHQMGIEWPWSATGTFRAGGIRRRGESAVRMHRRGDEAQSHRPVAR